MRLRPQTVLGRRAAQCFVLSVLLFGTFFVLVASGQRGGDTFFSNPSLAVTILGSGAAAIAGGVIGVFALWRHDRSIFVIAVVVAGGLALLWSAAELMFPH